MSIYLNVTLYINTNTLFKMKLGLKALSVRIVRIWMLFSHVYREMLAALFNVDFTICYHFNWRSVFWCTKRNETKLSSLSELYGNWIAFRMPWCHMCLRVYHILDSVFHELFIFNMKYWANPWFFGQLNSFYEWSFIHSIRPKMKILYEPLNEPFHIFWVYIWCLNQDG